MYSHMHPGDLQPGLSGANGFGPCATQLSHRLYERTTAAIPRAGMGARAGPVAGGDLSRSGRAGRGFSGIPAPAYLQSLGASGWVLDRGWAVHALRRQQYAALLQLGSRVRRSPLAITSELEPCSEKDELAKNKCGVHRSGMYTGRSTSPDAQVHATKRIQRCGWTSRLVISPTARHQVSPTRDTRTWPRFFVKRGEALRWLPEPNDYHHWTN